MILRRILPGFATAGVVAYLMVAPAAPALAYDPTTGEALHGACAGAAPHVCLSYLAGIIDMHEVGLPGGEGQLFCPENAPPEKVGRGGWLYYEQHPDALEQPAAFGAVQALALMFPCE